jgi:hypothetical protein
MLLWTNVAVWCENFVHRTTILSLGTIRAKKIDKPGYVRYNTFFHAPKNNEGESNLTLITWFPHRRPLYRWMRLIKRNFLVIGLVILKLTQPLIPAENPNSSKFNGTEGVRLKTYYGLRRRWMDKSRRVRHANSDKKIIQFLSVELTCGTFGSDHILTLFIKRRESQGHTQLSVMEEGCCVKWCSPSVCGPLVFWCGTHEGFS